ncbi:MAG: hypothetical protein B7C24_05085 [Bacteroidetes bacterium 4572_77]|nr:MAG: hypothetical protein B7C24_05085 [Bacteroidetes bacterium 4572_77]
MIIIDEHSKISDIIDRNEDAIEIIAMINSDFKKLKNPFLRKIFAKRVSILEAANIGGVSSDKILSELSKIGFSVQYSHTAQKNKIKQKTKSNQMSKKKTITLDVRPILESGIDPFKEIMAKLEEISDKEDLLIINTFEPIPLLNILKDKGYQYETTRPSPGEVHTLLIKEETNKRTQSIPSVNKKDWSFEDAEKAFEGKMTKVDVRHLEMPMPMVAVLEEIEKIGIGEALFVNHKKLPQYLIPELENRGFVFVSQGIDDQNINLIIYKS